MDDELDFSKLKYVLYARKSTDDPQRQVSKACDPSDLKINLNNWFAKFY